MNLKAQAGTRHFAPLIPPVARTFIRQLIRSSIKPMAAGIQAHREYEKGSWDDEVGFDHLKGWTSRHWVQMARGIHVEVRKQTSLKTLTVVTDPSDPAQVKAAARAAKKLAALAAEDRERILQQEEIAREAIAGAGEDPEELDAKKDLILLRKAIKRKMSIEEQADLLIAQARSTNPGASRVALGHIREIMGTTAASNQATPQMGALFSLPEGSGPAIR